MAVKRRDLPADPQAAAIVKVLDTITATGQRPNAIFADWLELVEGTLDMLPAHARSFKETGKPAEDSPDVAQVWERVRSHYQGKQWVFERFSEAFGLLINAAYPSDETPTYQDLVGSMYMSWGYPSSSSSPNSDTWVEVLEFNACILRSEAPINGRAAGIAVFHPGGDFLLQSFAVSNATVETLTTKDTKLDFSHVQPTAVLGGVMQLQLARDPMRFFRRECFIQGSQAVRVEIV